MITSGSQGSRAAVHDARDVRAHELHPVQDRSGPFDGELLDLYVALLIVVPTAFFLRSLWF
jgi:hypothetical protein